MEGTLGGRPGRRPRQIFEHKQENDADDFQEKAEEQKGEAGRSRAFLSPLSLHFP